MLSDTCTSCHPEQTRPSGNINWEEESEDSRHIGSTENLLISVFFFFFLTVYFFFSIYCVSLLLQLLCERAQNKKKILLSMANSGNTVISLGIDYDQMPENIPNVFLR